MGPVKSKFIFLMSASIIMLASCGEKLFTSTVDCEECYSEKPDSVDLILHVTISDKFSEVPVLIYEGSIDGGRFIDTLYCNATACYFFVKAENKYSAKAIYSDVSRTTIVVDGAKQKLKGVSDACEEYCWVIEDADLYLELAY